MSGVVRAKELNVGGDWGGSMPCSGLVGLDAQISAILVIKKLKKNQMNVKGII